MLSLQQLRVFVVCAEEGTFSSAARKLGKAQSVVSHTIANLEIDLNLELFDRTTRNPKLTKHGARLLPHARATLQQSQEFHSVAHSMDLDNESELEIAVDPSLLFSNLYKLLDRFNLQFPETNLTLNVAKSCDIPHLVKSGQTHFGLMLIDGTMPTGVELGLLGHLPFCVVAHHNHPLSQLKSVTRSSLALHRQLVFQSTEGKPAALLPEISPHKYCSNDFTVIRDMAELNLGWGYLPTHILENMPANSPLVKLPISFDIQTWTIPVDRVMQIDGIRGSALKWLEAESRNLFSVAVK
ncbi:LysR family transcriptional regulator [Catenovulum sp. 2E275]|uniref:LysR family transcriptional regulator n=1 Tax=Catenovulum sp. 2E275 TaxID=2980497 RepID=UPI0021D1BC65|nr:LysR family transcriptional regulator [Catenovulum sp. 2E275]MCU4674158.1 LysR family transcriptional regulator [Catenovulum sp. 2E275]